MPNRIDLEIFEIMDNLADWHKEDHDALGKMARRYLEIRQASIPPQPTGRVSAVDIRDPTEKKVALLLELLGIKYLHDTEDNIRTKGLDFLCGQVFIEAKQFHSDRIAEQMSRASDVIAFQGAKSVDLLIDAVLALKAGSNETA